MHQDEPSDPWERTEHIRRWIERVVAWIALGIPVALVTAAILSGESRESIIWAGIMGFMLGMIFWYGTTPRRFGLFPPGRRRRRR
jgi:FtsH-binding integral membrane protein